MSSDHEEGERNWLEADTENYDTPRSEAQQKALQRLEREKAKERERRAELHLPPDSTSLVSTPAEHIGTMTDWATGAVIDDRDETASHEHVIILKPAHLPALRKILARYQQILVDNGGYWGEKYGVMILEALVTTGRADREELLHQIEKTENFREAEFNRHFVNVMKINLQGFTNKK